MAKERPSEDKERKEHKKHKHSTENGVKKHKHSKDKHEKKQHRAKNAARETSTEPITSTKTDVAEVSAGDEEEDDVDDDKTLADTTATPSAPPETTGNAARDIAPASLVPFANPLADDKTTRKVLRGVRRGACEPEKAI